VPAEKAGLPGGIFSYQKFLYGYIWEDLGMENVGWHFSRQFGVHMYGH
jgi:hypothetical protein